jgi:hypothetical protein
VFAILELYEGVGCEKFAELAYKEMATILHIFKTGNTYYCPNGKTFEARYPVGQGVKLRSVEVFEHAGNSAAYEG